MQIVSSKATINRYNTVQAYFLHHPFQILAQKSPHVAVMFLLTDVSCIRCKFRACVQYNIFANALYN